MTRRRPAPMGRDAAPAPTLDHLSAEIWPHNDEAEKGVLGSVLLDPERLNDLAGDLKPEDFFRDDLGKIWSVILDLYANASAIDPITIVEELERRGWLAEIGGDETIHACLNAIPHAANARHYGDIVRQHSTARQLSHTARSILGDVATRSFTADELLERAEQEIFRVAESRTSESTAPARVAIAGALARLERRHRGPSGISSGLDDLDGMTDGAQPGQLVILAARPSMGKTQFGLNLFEYCTLARRDPALFISLEMGAQELGERLIVSRAGISNRKFKDPHTITDGEWGRLAAADQEWASAPALIDDSPALSTLQITALARRWKVRAGIKLLIVDYLQLVSPSEGESRQEEVASISRGLKRLARELGLAVVCLSQLNRASEKRADMRPRMGDLRESGAIEQDADVVLLLHRPDYYSADDRPGYAELIVAKNRNGAVGSVDLRFLKDVGRFEPWVSDVVPQATPATGPEF